MSVIILKVTSISRKVKKTIMANISKKIFILGSGTSTGVPMLGCSCNVCTSNDPYDQRMRSSFIIQIKNEQQKQKNILIDTGPDLRTQLLRAKMTHIDSVIITHEHADHLHGIDDLRPFCFVPENHFIPIYTSHHCAQTMRKRYPYIFHSERFYNEKKPVLGGGIPRLELHNLALRKKGFFSQVIEGLEFIFFFLPHGYGFTMGFITDGLAYLPDCHLVPPQVIQKCQQLKIQDLIIDCVQPLPHESHLCLEKAKAAILEIAPERAHLIHMNHFFSHRELIQYCHEHFLFPVAPLHDEQILHLN